MLTSGLSSQARHALFVAAGIVLSQGCFGGRDVPELAQVTGTVTLDGKPLPQASVVYVPVAHGDQASRPANGVTDESGLYKLQYSTTQSGARPGKYQVSISTFRDQGEDWSGNEVPGAPETVPSVYNSASTLTAEVKADGPPIDFALKSDAGPIVQPSPDAEDDAGQSDGDGC
jgi:hypothetical protein